MRNNEEGGFSPLDVIRTRAFIIIVSLIVTNVVLTLPMVIITLGFKFDVSKLYKFRVGRKFSVAFASNLDLYNKLFNSLLYLLWIKNDIFNACACKRRTGVRAVPKTNTTKLPVTALRKSDACVEH